MRVTNLLRAGGIYAVGAIAGRILPVLMVPVLTRILSKEDYGLVAMFALLVSVGTPVLTLSSPAALVRSHFKVDPEAQRRYVGTAVVQVMLFAVVATVLCATLDRFLTPATGFARGWHWLVGIAAGCAGINEIILRVWQANERPVRFVSYQLTVTALEAAVTMACVLTVLADWRGRVFGRLIALALGATWAVWHLRRHRLAHFRFERQAFREIAKFGVPLLPVTASILGLTFADRWFLANMSGLAEVGLYAVGYQIASAVSTFVAVVKSVWTPYALKRLARAEKGDRRAIVVGSFQCAAALLAVALVVTTLAPFVLSVFVGEEFQDALPYVVWLALGSAARGIYVVALPHFYHAGATSTLSRYSIFAFVVNVVLCPIFIWTLGPWGAALSTFVAFFVHALSTCYGAWRLFRRVTFADE